VRQRVGHVFDDPIGFGRIWTIRRPRWRRSVMLAVERHGPPDGPFAGGLLPRPLGHQPAHAKAPSAWVVPLHRQHLREKREREVVRGVRLPRMTS